MTDKPDVHIKHFKLVYAPENAIFEKLLNDTAVSLELDGIVNVTSASQIEDVMFRDELLAGVEFDHPAVGI